MLSRRRIFARRSVCSAAFGATFGAALTPGRAENYTGDSSSAGVGAGKAVKIGHGPATVSGFSAVSQVTRPRRGRC